MRVPLIDQDTLVFNRGKHEGEDISIHHPEAIIEPGTNRKAHPCQMPEGLAARAIKFSTDPGDIVLDPFFGSGTVPVVAAKLDRRFMACEIEEKFCELALNRFREDMFLDSIEVGETWTRTLKFI